MNELVKKLIESGKQDALESKESALAAAIEIGYSEEDARKMLGSFDGFPLDDDDLCDVDGGGSISRSTHFGGVDSDRYFYKCKKCRSQFNKNYVIGNPSPYCPHCGGELELCSHY